MKLRIRGNSLRLRLSQIEVASLQANGEVSDRIGFPNESALAYVLVVDDAIHATQATFKDAAITIAIPATTLHAWLDPTQVSIHGSQALGEGTELTILIEKDFACLEPREGEDQEDLFRNPGSKPC